VFGQGNRRPRARWIMTDLRGGCETMGETLNELDEAPEVSVIIPAYSAAAYIQRALESVRAQTFNRLETIVINDGSPDTAQLECVLDQSPVGVRYLKQVNKGPGAARNAGIGMARGRFLAFLDADDYWAPNYLAEQLAVFQSDPDVDLVYADALLTENPLLAGKTFMALTPSQGSVDFEGLVTARCTVILSGTVVRKQSAIDAGLFDERLSHSEDYDLWLRMAKAGARMVYRKKLLLFRRELPSSLCGNPIKLRRCQVRVFLKLLRGQALTGGEKALVEKQLQRTQAGIKLEQARQCFAKGQFARAERALRAANRVLRSRKLGLVMLWLRCAPRLLLGIHKYRERRLLDPDRFLWRVRRSLAE